MSVVRYLTNEDLLQYQRLASICYTYVYAEPPRHLTEEELHQRVGVFHEDGTLLSAMIHNRYMARFDGQDVPLVGIGGVVTDPVARGQRGIRRLFETYLPALYDEGYVFSALFPFSHGFYRKFGYELAFERRVADIGTDRLRDDLYIADEIVRVLPDENDQGMRTIYEQYIADKHFAIKRDEAMWRDIRQGAPWEKMKYAYVLKRQGEGVAYWIGTAEKHGFDAVLNIEDIAYTCREGYEAVFAMLHGMNEVEIIRLTVPAEIEPRWLVKEPYDVTYKSVNCGGMLRVVNVEKALTMIAPPSVAGSLTIEITDAQIAQNNGYFKVEGDGGKLVVTREQDADPDMVCDITGLSALVGGLQAFEDGLRAGHALLKNEQCKPFAAALFPKRKTHLNWNF